MATSTALGPAHEIDLPGGRIRYHETGEGAPVVFAHGLIVNADLWRKVVPVVAAAGYRCITPDWPLGSHSIPMPHADLTPPGVADLMAAFLEKLDLNDVTWVANDTGGALTQILLTRNPDRIGRVVLASVDSYDSFFPGGLKALTLLAKIPGSMRPMTELLRIRALHSLSISFGMAAKYPMPPEVIDSYLLPSRNSGAIRKDLRRFVKSVKSSYTLDAAKRFGAVRQPVLLAWAAQDRFFPVSYAERLAADLPNATLRLIDDSYTFLPEDQPELLAEAILEFTRLHATP
ncbi:MULTISPECIES: alpha/beta fold hydrolase [unclassified Nocardia]|uniref:alpha/beta fold hydrolase n=1 Tax=unclassified Nocardia TaxID=2637762 RepID=UPI001CE4935B|nr:MULTISPECIES: alpha/beta hydrolase [unclassified Nocardia]